MISVYLLLDLSFYVLDNKGENNPLETCAACSLCSPRVRSQIFTNTK